LANAAGFLTLVLTISMTESSYSHRPTRSAAHPAYFALDLNSLAFSTEVGFFRAAACQLRPRLIASHLYGYHYSY
jgi:hypothetical protein